MGAAVCVAAGATASVAISLLHVVWSFVPVRDSICGGGGNLNLFLLRNLSFPLHSSSSDSTATVPLLLLLSSLADEAPARRYTLALVRDLIRRAGRGLST